MKTLKFSLIGATTAMALGCSMDRYPTEPDASSGPISIIARISIDASAHSQTLEGFGAAVAWYGETFAGFPDGSPIFDLAFRDLGLDILRFRNHYGRTDSAFLSDISAEVRLLERATQSLGHEPRVLLSSWSPPGTLKASGKENCTGDKATCTLAKDSNGQYVYDQFGAHFVDALTFYAASGIHPYYLSIQNEPDFVPNGWEGCRFSPTETTTYPGYDKALAAVHFALAAASYAPKLTGPECFSLANDSLGNFLLPQTQSLLYGAAHHLYQSEYWRAPDSYVPTMTAANSAANGMPLLQTEFDTADGSNEPGGFETAWVMHNALAVEGASGFLYWGLVWPGLNGLIGMANGTYTVRNQYYAMRHFARYTDPGYVRVNTTSSNSDIRISAYLSPDNQQLTAVVLNTGLSEVQLKWDTINNFDVGTSEIYRSTFVDSDAGTSELWNALGTLNANQALKMPSHSVATVVLHAQ